MLYFSLLNKKIQTEFGKKHKDVVGGRLMLFGDFMDIGTDDKKYVEINDQEEVRGMNYLLKVLFFCHINCRSI